MSNEVVAYDLKPIDTTTRKASTAMDTTSDAGSGIKKISIRGSRFRMVVDGEEQAVSGDDAMEVVILDATPHERTYYDKPYVQGEVFAPLCWSDDNVNPSEHCDTPQSSDCESCEFNAAGSGNGNSRACKFSRRLAVTLGGDIDGDVYGIQIPATTIFGKTVVEGKYQPFNAYGSYLKTHESDLTWVVTEMKFDPSVATPKLVFRPVRLLTEEEQEKVYAKIEEAKASGLHTGPRKFDFGENDKDSKPEVKAKKKASKKGTPKKDGSVEDIIGDWKEKK